MLAPLLPHDENRPGIGAFIRRDDLIDTTRIWAWHLRDDDKDARRTKILNGIVDQVSLLLAREQQRSAISQGSPEPQLANGNIG